MNPLEHPGLVQAKPFEWRRHGQGAIQTVKACHQQRHPDELLSDSEAGHLLSTMSWIFLLHCGTLRGEARTDTRPHRYYDEHPSIRHTRRKVLAAVGLEFDPETFPREVIWYGAYVSSQKDRKRRLQLMAAQTALMVAPMRTHEIVFPVDKEPLMEDMPGFMDEYFERSWVVREYFKRVFYWEDEPECPRVKVSEMRDLFALKQFDFPDAQKYRLVVK